MKDNGEITDIKKRYAIILSILFSLFILTAGYIYYRYEENRIRNEKYDELKAIAGLKIDQIVHWYENRQADALAISRSPSFIKGVEKFLQKRNNDVFANEIIERITSIDKHYGYENTLLADTSGHIILSKEKNTIHLDKPIIPKIREAIRTGQNTFTDFYLCNLSNEIHYDVISPLINKEKKTIAVLIYRYDPNAYLFPLIQKWPMPSRTAETILLRREDGNVLFINGLRHKKNSTLKFRIPLTHTEVLAVYAALGNNGIFRGNDYSGKKVLAYITSIKGTPWFMVAKINEQEIFSELNYKAVIVIILSILALTSLWAGLAFIYNNIEKNIYRSSLKLIEESETRYKNLFIFTNDGICLHEIICGMDGIPVDYVILDANKKYEEITGLSKDNIIGKRATEIYQSEQAPYIELFSKVALTGEPIYFETFFAPMQKHFAISVYSPGKGKFATVFQDITVRKQAEQSLIESEERFRMMFEKHQAAMVLIQPEKGYIVDANDAAVNFYGYSKEILKQMSIRDINQLTPDEITEEQDKALREERNYFVFPHRLADGDVRWVEVYSSPVKLQGKSLLFSIIHDITDRKKAEEARLESEAKLLEAQKLSHVGSFEIDIETEKIKWSEEIFNIHERNIHEGNPSYKEALGYVHPEDKVRILEELKNGMESNQTFDINYRIVVNGKIKYIHYIGNPVLDSSGKIIKRSGAMMDITERIIQQKILEEALDNLRNSETKLLEAQRLAHMCSFVFDFEENSFEWTEEFSNIFEIDPVMKFNKIEEMIAFVYPDDKDYVQASLKKAAEEKAKSLQLEYRIITGLGKMKYLNYKEELFFNDQGLHTKRFGTITDITERKLYEIELGKTMEELRRSNKDLEQFAYVASHDLQEPIRMVKSYTELLKQRFTGKLNDNEKIFFGFISEGAVRMNELVNALLQYSRLSSSKHKFDTVDCNLILADVLKDLQVSIEETKAVINSDELPIVKGNKVMLRQLLQNLLHNAIKFKGGCAPEIKICKKRINGYWMISVKDNGIGIEPEYYDKIFVIFQKLHTRDKYPGTGIGLAVCKKIVEIHGGQLYVDSIKGKGTTFSFTLPDAEV